MCLLIYLQYVGHPPPTSSPIIGPLRRRTKHVLSVHHPSTAAPHHRPGWFQGFGIQVFILSLSTRLHKIVSPPTPALSAAAAAARGWQSHRLDSGIRATSRVPKTSDGRALASAAFASSSTEPRHPPSTASQWRLLSFTRISVMMKVWEGICLRVVDKLRDFPGTF